mgnify:CR=1 FL=1
MAVDATARIAASSAATNTTREGAARVPLRPEDEARCGGPAWLDTAAVDRMVDAIYPLYRESGPFSAQLLLAQKRGAA